MKEGNRVGRVTKATGEVFVARIDQGHQKALMQMLETPL